MKKHKIVRVVPQVEKVLRDTKRNCKKYDL